MPNRIPIRASLRLCICAWVALLVCPQEAHGLQIQELFRDMLDKRLQQAEEATPDSDSFPSLESTPTPEIQPLPESEEPATAESGLAAGNEFQSMLNSLAGSANPNADPMALDSFEFRAIQNHPQIKILFHEVEALRAESHQASLRPNPSLRFFADEVFNEGNAGLWGASITTTNVPSEKLRRRAQVKNNDAATVIARIQTTRQQIATDVRTAFYNVLISQRQHELATQLADSYIMAINQTEKLIQGGEATRAQLLQIEVQYQQALTRQNRANSLYDSAWRQLAAVVGDETMVPQPLSGSLDEVTQTLDFNAVLADLVQRSPELKVAVAGVQQARSVVDRELAEALPNTQTQWTLGRDALTEDVFVGMQYSVPIQKYNRNQGNISAARSRLSAAYHNTELLARQLAQRLAQEFQAYESAQSIADQYVNEILPKSREAAQLVNRAFKSGEADFLQVLTAQRTLIESTNDYLVALQRLWLSRQKIEGLLLSNSLGDNSGGQ